MSGEVQVATPIAFAPGVSPKLNRYCHASSAKSLSSARCSAPAVSDVAVSDVAIPELAVFDVGVSDVAAASSVKAESSAAVWESV